jgi:hypothetical protein
MKPFKRIYQGRSRVENSRPDQDVGQRRLKGKFLTVAALTCLGVLTYLLLLSREPTAHGESLSYWLDQETAFSEVTPEAAEAIRQLGVKAIPALVRKVTRTESTAHQILRKLQDSRHLKIPGLHLEPAYVDWNRGARGFKVLGVAAEPAIPELKRWMDKEICPAGVLQALAAINPKLLLDFAALSHPNPDIRRHSLNALAFWGDRRSGIAIPVILTSLQDSNDFVRLHAASALGRIGEPLDLILPALIQSLEDKSPDVRTMTVIRIGELAERNIAALAGLSNAMQSTDQAVRREATNRLLRVKLLQAF